jgi:hypothetical protein
MNKRLYLAPTSKKNHPIFAASAELFNLCGQQKILTKQPQSLSKAPQKRKAIEVQIANQL